jgi:hypothetical protein
MLRNLESILRLIVAIVVTVATELTVQWNTIQNILSVSSAGQTIPLILGIGTFVRVCYVYSMGLLGDDDSEHSSDEDFRPNSFISGALHSVADHSMPEMPI